MLIFFPYEFIWQMTFKVTKKRDMVLMYYLYLFQIYLVNYFQSQHLKVMGYSAGAHQYKEHCGHSNTHNVMENFKFSLQCAIMFVVQS